MRCRIYIDIQGSGIENRHYTNGMRGCQLISTPRPPLDAHRWMLTTRIIYPCWPLTFLPSMFCCASFRLSSRRSMQHCGPSVTGPPR